MTDFRAKSDGYRLGKEIVILMTIIFSGLSFGLGYFVGKKVGSGSPAPALVVEATPEMSAPSGAPLAAPQADAPAAALHSPAGPAEPSEQAPTHAAPLSENTALRTEKVPHPEEGRQPERKNAAESASRKPADTKTAAPQTGLSAGKKEVYTVQVGAFRNSADAKSLKHKCEKMGLTASIVTAKAKNGEKIFKVRAGEFSSRRDAEILALKLKKTEGLKTFVTAGTD